MGGTELAERLTGVIYATTSKDQASERVKTRSTVRVPRRVEWDSDYTGTAYRGSQ